MPPPFDPFRHSRYDGFMQRPHVLLEQRKHPRAPLKLPARVRWQEPLGMRLEVTETIDVSREGVLLRSHERADAGLCRAWIVFPFDAADRSATDPEVPARVTRVEREPSGEYRIGLQLEPPRRSRGSFPAASERRASPRVAVCLPILVRTDGMPWPEETMTRDFSRRGVKFDTSHVYATGEMVRAKIPWGEWAEAGEISGRVVRVEPIEEETTARSASCNPTVLGAVAVEWADVARRPMRAGEMHRDRE